MQHHMGNVIELLSLDFVDSEKFRTFIYAELQIIMKNVGRGVILKHFNKLTEHFNRDIGSSNISLEECVVQFILLIGLETFYNRSSQTATDISQFIPFIDRIKQLKR